VAEKVIETTGSLLRELLEKRGIRIEQIVLFGSLTEGSTQPDSDIDLIVVSDDFSHDDIFERSRKTRGIHRELVRRLHIPIDLLYYSSREWRAASSPILKEAKTHGRLLLK
jgi:uncharacterized protein